LGNEKPQEIENMLEMSIKSKFAVFGQREITRNWEHDRDFIKSTFAVFGNEKPQEIGNMIEISIKSTFAVFGQRETTRNWEHD
jgi:hypothetical protein